METQQPSGAIYGVILNDRASLERLGPALAGPPYKGAPKAPVLYIKPANTRRPAGTTVVLPAGETRVEIGATVGALIGREASRLRVAGALDVVGGYALAADLSLPHASYYRPAIREKCFDGACPVGPLVAPALAGNVEELTLEIRIGGELRERRSLGNLVRGVARLLADVTEFMTLRRGDMLLVGVAWQAVQAEAGSRVTIAAERLGALEFTLARGPS